MELLDGDAPMQCPHGDIHSGIQINLNLTDNSPPTWVIPLTTGINDSTMENIAEALHIPLEQLMQAMDNVHTNPHLRYLH